MKIGNRPVAIVVVVVIFGALSSALVAAAFGDFGQWEEKQARHLPGAVDPDRSPIETTKAFLSYMVELHPLQGNGMEEPGEFDKRDDARLAFMVLFFLGAITVGFAGMADCRSTTGSLPAATLNLACGLVNALIACAHTTGVTAAMLSEEPFRYDFVRYSAMLYGLAWGIPALVCLVSVKGLTTGRPVAHRWALGASVALVAVNAPVIPIHSGASIPVILGSLNALALLLVRRRFRRSGAALRAVGAGFTPAREGMLASDCGRG